MKKQTILVILIALLSLAILLEFSYLFLIKPTISNVSTKKISTSNNLVTKNLPTVTYIVDTTSTAPNEVNKFVKITEDTTKRISDLMTHTVYLTKKTELIQEYEGTLTSIKFIDKDIEVKGKIINVAIEFSLQSDIETPTEFQYSKDTKQRIIVYDVNLQKINVESLKTGDRLHFKVKYDVSSTPSILEEIEITKLN